MGCGGGTHASSVLCELLDAIVGTAGDRRRSSIDPRYLHPFSSSPHALVSVHPFLPHLSSCLLLVCAECSLMAHALTVKKKKTDEATVARLVSAGSVPCCCCCQSIIGSSYAARVCPVVLVCSAGRCCLLLSAASVWPPPSHARRERQIHAIAGPHLRSNMDDHKRLCAAVWHDACVWCTEIPTQQQQSRPRPPRCRAPPRPQAAAAVQAAHASVPRAAAGRAKWRTLRCSTRDTTLRRPQSPRPDCRIPSASTAPSWPRSTRNFGTANSPRTIWYGSSNTAQHSGGSEGGAEREERADLELTGCDLAVRVWCVPP